jgi:heme/copper-type cytochrome/quinol oxidase subunit 3
MTAIPITEDRLLRSPLSSRSEVGFWGMALFCATETALFAYLLTGYFYLGVRNAHWPPAGVEDPKLALPLIMTALLLTSSVVLYWGERGIKHGQHWRLRAGLAIAIVLGIGFLAFQAREYAEKLRHFDANDHAYGAMFYTITGFHGLHVAFGVLVLSFTLLRAMRGHFDAEHHSGVTVTSLYWHTVDAIWLVILASLYLSPHWY